MTDQAKPAPEFFELQRVVAGRYSLVREIGRGGMGIVFLARDVSLERLVAIKLLPPSLARDPAGRERFLREARLAAQLAHPHIVPIHDVAVTSDLAYFVMGYIEGESLGARVRRRGPLSVAETVRIMTEVSWALAHAHARGIVHRDIKADNILLDRASGRALVTDFGIAFDGGAASGESPLVGTPQYMSPELLRGEPADAQSDIFALGVTTWFALTGRHPVESPSASGLLVRQGATPLPSIRTVIPTIAPPLARTIDATLAFQKEDRPASADALAMALDAASSHITQVPSSVRDFVRQAQAAADDMQSAIVGAGSSAVLLAVSGKLAGGAGTGFLAGTNDLFAGLVVLTLGLVFVGMGLVRFGGVFLSARELAHDGYGIDDVRAGLVSDEAGEPGAFTPELRRERRRRALMYTLTLGAKTAVALGLAMLDRPAWVYLPAAVMAVLIPAYGVRTIATLLRDGPTLWSRLLKGRAGAWLFRGARLFQRHREAPDRPLPTVHALAGDVEAALRALPSGAASQLEALASVVRQLQTESLELESRRDRPEAQRRLGDIAMELEAMRMELLAAHADAFAPSDVTRQVDRAREIGERLERALRATPIPEKLKTPV